MQKNGGALCTKTVSFGFVLIQTVPRQCTPGKPEAEKLKEDIQT